MKEYSFIDCNYFTKDEEDKKNAFKNSIKEFKDLDDAIKSKKPEYYPNQVEIKNVEKGE